MIEPRLSAIALSFCAMMAAGCGDSDSGDVAARGVSVDQRTQSVLGSDLLSVNGTYGASCQNRSGSWSLALASGAPLDHPALSVVRNDTACVLTMTELNTTSSLTAVPSINLGASYQASASAFGSPVAFYANAILTPAGFAGDFVITVRFSDDAHLVGGGQMATFVSQTATVSAQSVSSPDYTIDLTGLAIQTDVHDIVQTATGNAVLTAGTVTGTKYAVVSAAGLSTYDAVDGAYLGATSAALTTSIAAAGFGLIGSDLTMGQVRTLIVANIANGIRSYEVFELTFSGP